MIVHGFVPLEIGAIVTKDVLAPDGDYYTTRMLVLREASFDELVTYVHSCGLKLSGSPYATGTYIYEVSVD